METGYFVTFEGCEGTGKSTQLHLAAEWLVSQGHSVLVTREPGGTALAEEIRHLLLTPREEAVSPDAELLMMFAARAQHMQEKINPALARGEWVLCDRFTDATYVYQGYGRGVELQKIAMLEELIQGPVRPTKTLLFDTDISTGMSRARSRSDFDRIEQESIAFFQRVREGYLELARSAPGRYECFDAAQSIDMIHQQVKASLQALMNKAASR